MISIRAQYLGGCAGWRWVNGYSHHVGGCVGHVMIDDLIPVQIRL